MKNQKNINNKTNKKSQEEMIRSLVKKEVKKKLQEIQKESNEDKTEKWSSNQKATFGFTILNFLISLARLILSFL